MYVLRYMITKSVIHVHVSFVLCFVIQLPEVCSYQAIEYTVTVWENGTVSGGNAILVLQVNGTCNENCSRKKIDLFSLGHSHLMAHRYYWIMVEASTEAGTSTSAPQDFRMPLFILPCIV